MSKAYNPTPTKWLGTHCVSARTAAQVLRYKSMGAAWRELDDFQKYEVMKANNRRNRSAFYDPTINPFTLLKSDSTIIPCDFKLSDGTQVSGRYWEEGTVVLITARGKYCGGRYVRVH